MICKCIDVYKIYEDDEFKVDCRLNKKKKQETK